MRKARRASGPKTQSEAVAFRFLADEDLLPDPPAVGRESGRVLAAVDREVGGPPFAPLYRHVNNGEPIWESPA